MAGIGNHFFIDAAELVPGIFKMEISHPANRKYQHMESCGIGFLRINMGDFYTKPYRGVRREDILFITAEKDIRCYSNGCRCCGADGDNQYHGVNSDIVVCRSLYRTEWLALFCFIFYGGNFLWVFSAFLF